MNIEIFGQIVNYIWKIVPDCKHSDNKMLILNIAYACWRLHTDHASCFVHQYKRIHIWT